MPFATTTTNTVLFLSIFILAFFPNLFAYLLRLPLLPLQYAFSATPTTILDSPTPSCACCCSPTPVCSTVQLTSDTIPSMAWFQKQFALPTKSRGSYLITDTVMKELPEIKDYKVGLLNLFIQHTSCALSLNENWDTDVRYVYCPPFYLQTYIDTGFLQRRHVRRP